MLLRPYQVELVERVRHEFANGARSVVMQAGTGSGKTTMAADVLRRSVAIGRRAVFLAHLDTLVEDTGERLAAAGVHAGFVQSGRAADPLAPVQVCSIGTLNSRPDERPPADLVIVDECHRAMAARVRQILGCYPNARILGLTATPQRGDGQPLGDVFDRLVCGPSVRELQRLGFLVPVDVIAPPDAVEHGLVCDPVEAYERWTPGKRAIVFASNVAHAEELAGRFNERGHTAGLFVGETGRAERRDLRAKLTTGDLRVLVSVNAIVEGFDVPAVEVAILARSFTVCGSFLQAIGRTLRPSSETGKTRATVLDLRGAVNLHGLPDEDRTWSLDGTAVCRTETIPALRKCAECWALFRPATRCPRCGATMEAAPKLPRNLNRAEVMQRVSALPQDERDRRYLESLERVALGRLRLPVGRASTWARAQFYKRFGREPECRRAA